MAKQTPRSVSRADLEAVVALIAAKREKLGMSQRELSRRIGLYEMAVMEIERGNRGLQVTELIDAAKVLGEDPADLLSRALSKLPA